MWKFTLTKRVSVRREDDGRLSGKAARALAYGLSVGFIMLRKIRMP